MPEAIRDQSTGTTLRINSDGSIYVKLVDGSGNVIKSVRKFESLSGSAGSGGDGDPNQTYTLLTSDTSIDIVEVYLDGVLLPTTWSKNNTLKQVTIPNNVFDTQTVVVYYYV